MRTRHQIVINPTPKPTVGTPQVDDEKASSASTVVSLCAVHFLVESVHRLLEPKTAELRLSDTSSYWDFDKLKTMFKQVLLLLAAQVVQQSVAFLPSSIQQSTQRPIGDLSSTRIFESVAPSAGFIKTVTKEGGGDAVTLGDIATVKYTCYLPEDSKSAPFARSDRQKMVSFAFAYR